MAETRRSTRRAAQRVARLAAAASHRADRSSRLADRARVRLLHALGLAAAILPAWRLQGIWRTIWLLVVTSILGFLLACRSGLAGRRAALARRAGEGVLHDHPRHAAAAAALAALLRAGLAVPAISVDPRILPVAVSAPGLALWRAGADAFLCRLRGRGDARRLRRRAARPAGSRPRLRHEPLEDVPPHLAAAGAPPRAADAGRRNRAAAEGDAAGGDDHHGRHLRASPRGCGRRRSSPTSRCCCWRWSTWSITGILVFALPQARGAHSGAAGYEVTRWTTTSHSRCDEATALCERAAIALPAPTPEIARCRSRAAAVAAEADGQPPSGWRISSTISRRWKPAASTARPCPRSPGRRRRSSCPMPRAAPRIPASTRAFDDSSRRPTSFGLALFTQKNAYTCGALGYFAGRLAEQGLAAIAATNGPALLAGSGSTKPVYCTNPMAFAAPVAGGPPLIIDQSSSATAFVNIRSGCRRPASRYPRAGRWMPRASRRPMPSAGHEGRAAGLRRRARRQHRADGRGAVGRLSAAPTGRSTRRPSPSGSQSPGTGLTVIALATRLVDPGFEAGLRRSSTGCPAMASTFPAAPKAPPAARRRPRAYPFRARYTTGSPAPIDDPRGHGDPRKSRGR